jgi:hypothetical protein
MCHVSQSRIKNFKASVKVIFIGFGRRKTSGNSSFTNTRNIFTFVDKRNKTTINGNEIKHNERNKKVYKTKTNSCIYAPYCWPIQQNYGLKFSLDWRLKHSCRTGRCKTRAVKRLWRPWSMCDAGPPAYFHFYLWFLFDAWFDQACLFWLLFKITT